MNGWTTNGIAIGSNVANSTDRAWGFRMLLPPISITTMAVNVQTAANATSYLRLALYAADGTNGEPGTLLQDAGTVAINSTGTKTATFTSLPVGGWYWAVAFSSVTGTVVPKLAAPSDAIAGFLLSDISSNVGVFKTHGYVTYTYPANAPSTCPTLDATHIQPASGAAFYIGVI